MNILTRDKIIELIKRDKDIINDSEAFFQSDINNKFLKSSHIQQCSVDLHIGNIYLPELKENNRGSASNPIETEHVLQTGQTALIRTKEEVRFPTNIAGICFAPSRITLKGVLITNMGHVDPGYKGHLHFTIINMGKSPYVLRNRDIICTMLLIELNSNTEPFGEEIIKNEIPYAVSENLPKLSKDFLDIERRSKSIAKNEVSKAKFWSISIPLLVALIGSSSIILQNYFGQPWKNDIDKIIQKVDKLENKIDISEKINEIEMIKREILEIQKELKNK
jgi:deoxycytidine triphosphate deaminase